MYTGPVSKPTVFIVGAGGSIPYGFPSGEGLLASARVQTANRLVDIIRPAARTLVPSFQFAVQGTLDRSLDAMLELRTDIVDAGKAFMARTILVAEAAHREIREDRPGAWHRILWDAFDLRSIDSFRSTPLKIITYNYDRSIEYALVRSLRERFQLTLEQCALALDRIGPIHLHGQLGFMPGFARTNANIVPYGGNPSGITDDECATAARSIRIIHEPKPTDEAFIRARVAISEAERVVFLGFGFARRNVERLQLHDCMKETVHLYLCTTGFSPEQQRAFVLPSFQPRWRVVSTGDENDDIVRFFRRYPEIFL